MKFLAGELEMGGSHPLTPHGVCWAGPSLLLGCPGQEGPQAVAEALPGHSWCPFIPVWTGRLQGGTGFLSTLFIERIHTLFIPSLFIALCLVSPLIQGIHQAVKGGLASGCVLRMLMDLLSFGVLPNHCMVDQCAQVSCGSGLWMNGSFDSGQPKEATTNTGCGQTVSC